MAAHQWADLPATSNLPYHDNPPTPPPSSSFPCILHSHRFGINVKRLINRAARAAAPNGRRRRSICQHSPSQLQMEDKHTDPHPEKADYTLGVVTTVHLLASTSCACIFLYYLTEEALSFYSGVNMANKGWWWWWGGSVSVTLLRCAVS